MFGRLPNWVMPAASVGNNGGWGVPTAGVGNNGGWEVPAAGAGNNGGLGVPAAGIGNNGGWEVPAAGVWNNGGWGVPATGVQKYGDGHLDAEWVALNHAHFVADTLNIGTRRKDIKNEIVVQYIHAVVVGRHYAMNVRNEKLNACTVYLFIV